MSLESLIKDLKQLLSHLSHDLEKAENGNKAAAQRVRTGTVKLEKTAKKFRKESIVAEKKGLFDKAKKAAKSKKATSKKKSASPQKEATKPHTAKHAKKAVKAAKPVKHTKKAAHKPAAKKAAPKSAAKKAAPKSAVKKASARVKTSAQKKISRPRSLSLKRPTAKLPQKRASF